MSALTEVMIIDDDQEIQTLLRKLFSLENHRVTAFTSAGEALGELSRRKQDGRSICDLVVCDLKLPDLSGLEFIERARHVGLAMPVILITAHGSVETAVEALKKGAFDYVLKPINLVEMNIIAKRAIQLRQLEADRDSLREQLQQTQALGAMIGKSPKIRQVFDLVGKVSRSASNVLVTGESGTGKEMVARAIHAGSSRAAMPFVAINCSAIPGTLLESELFGHKKGAFTGAQDARVGLFEDADGGTVFLDEIGDMPLELQAKLLRVIQEREIKPVGENHARPVDVRIVAATHQELPMLVKEGKFRGDLYYRLCVIPIHLPPLRERKEDIPILAEHFLKKFGVISRDGEKKLSKAALAKLIDARWAGNVRELENTIERAVVLSEQGVIGPDDIRLEESLESRERPENHFSRLMTLAELERAYIQYVLSQPQISKEKAAEILGIDRKTLYRKELKLI